MRTFRYERPTSLTEAIEVLGPDSRVLAGGSDLLVQLRTGAPAPGAVIDVKAVPELRTLVASEDSLTLGAAVSCWELSHHRDLRERLPGVVEASELIGSMQIQGRATVGGNLCNASPAADTTPALIAADARCVIAGPEGERELEVESFVTAPGRNALAPGELLVALRFPAPRPRTGDAYLRFTPRAEMDIAVVGVGVRIVRAEDGRCEEARVALGAVAERPLRAPAVEEALVGSALTSADLGAAAALASDVGDPISDKRGTRAYRQRLASVLTRRALEIALTRAGGAR